VLKLTMEGSLSSQTCPDVVDVVTEIPENGRCIVAVLVFSAASFGKRKVCVTL
jgi:hypothetical protein